MVLAGSDTVVAHTSDCIKEGWRLPVNAVATVVEVNEDGLLRLRTSDGVVSCWLRRSKFKFLGDPKQQPTREPRSGGKRAQRKQAERALAEQQAAMPTPLRAPASVSPEEDQETSPICPAENSERPSDSDIASCVSVLRRLRPNDLESPELQELLEVAGNLFRRKFFKDKFGADDAVDFLKKRIDMDRKINKLQTLEDIVHGSRDATRTYVEGRGINVQRKENLEQIKAEMALMDADDSEKVEAITNGDANEDNRDTAASENAASENNVSDSVEDESKLAEAASNKIGPKGDYHRVCNGCGASYRKMHHFYHYLCPDCADMSWEKRNQTADMTGMVCVVTGGRVRIGYQIVLKLLRQGAFVLTTTRFPLDSALRFSREEDFDVWRDRLEIVGPLELTNIPLVERFCDQLIARFPRIHVLINNAAQTLTRSEGWHYRMAELEDHANANLTKDARRLVKTPADLEQFTIRDMSAGAAQTEADADDATADNGTPEAATAPASMSPEEGTSGKTQSDSQHLACNRAMPSTMDACERVWSDAIDLADFPKGKLDDSRQPLDLTEVNSWDRRLCNVSSVELLQTLAANTAAPFIMCGRLACVLAPPTKSGPYGHIVNVAALEGKFSVKKKSKCHPHTNMAKAALNMLTHTSANDLFAKRILMNSADTGWVTDMASRGVGPIAATHATFVAPPLDEADGAARVLDPVFSHLKDPTWLIRGKYFKDFFVANW
eukprot:TRINITY_DN37172_c0_g1_i1.p1 TRINITY_DN37172_c0_g1~~TRINITY_DN37172_c0_g1_i1.p1  ORF type:complete len:755 (+),score=140.96 TRINITY_DN37172_c0_g1_i1:94-2265(+)